jgi:hypothetical protein
MNNLYIIKWRQHYANWESHLDKMVEQAIETGNLLDAKDAIAKIMAL